MSDESNEEFLARLEADMMENLGDMGFSAIGLDEEESGEEPKGFNLISHIPFEILMIEVMPWVNSHRMLISRMPPSLQAYFTALLGAEQMYINKFKRDND